MTKLEYWKAHGFGLSHFRFNPDDEVDEAFEEAVAAVERLFDEEDEEDEGRNNVPAVREV